MSPEQLMAAAFYDELEKLAKEYPALADKLDPQQLRASNPHGPDVSTPFPVSFRDASGPKYLVDNYMWRQRAPKRELTRTAKTHWDVPPTGSGPYTTHSTPYDRRTGARNMKRLNMAQGPHGTKFQK